MDYCLGQDFGSDVKELLCRENTTTVDILYVKTNELIAVYGSDYYCNNFTIYC